MNKRLMLVVLIFISLSSCNFSSASPGIPMDEQQKDQEVSQMEFDIDRFSTVFQFGDDVIELGTARVNDLINIGYEVTDKQELPPDNQFFDPVLVTFKNENITLPIKVYVFCSFRGDRNRDYFSEGITYSVFLQSENLPDTFSYHGEKMTDISLDTIIAWSGFSDDDTQYEEDSFQCIDIETEYSKVTAYFETDQETVSKLEVAISRDVFWRHADEFMESLGFKNK